MDYQQCTAQYGHSIVIYDNVSTNGMEKCVTEARYEVGNAGTHYACTQHALGMVTWAAREWAWSDTATVKVLPEPEGDGETYESQYWDGADVWEHVGDGKYSFVYRTGVRGVPTDLGYLIAGNPMLRPVIGPPLMWNDERTRLEPSEVQL